MDSRAADNKTPEKTHFPAFFSQKNYFSPLYARAFPRASQKLNEMKDLGGHLWGRKRAPNEQHSALT
jgi:hypothetical protein